MFEADEETLPFKIEAGQYYYPFSLFYYFLFFLSSESFEALKILLLIRGYW